MATKQKQVLFQRPMMKFYKCNEAAAAKQGADKAEMVQGGDGKVKDQKGTESGRAGDIGSKRKKNKCQTFQNKNQLQGTQERPDTTLRDTVEDTEK